MARRPNLAGAGADLAFAVLALASGWFGASLLYFGLVLAGAVAAWLWTRRVALDAMPAAQRVTNGALALVLIGAVLGGAYWLGLALGGHA